MENHPYDEIIGSKDAPFTNRLAAECGLATNFHNITHPVAAELHRCDLGRDTGHRDDCQPSECPRDVQSVFGQLQAAGKSWTAYQESMPAPCSLSSESGTNPPGNYAPKHNPAVYYLPLRPAAAGASCRWARRRPAHSRAPSGPAHSRASASSLRTSATTRTTAPCPREMPGSHAGCARSSRAPPIAASGPSSSSPGTRAREEAPTTAPPTPATAAATSPPSS